MRKSPFNYLVTLSVGAVLWVVTAVFYAGTFSESLMLAESTPEDFLANFRIFLGIAAAIGIAAGLYWYFYGSREQTAGELPKAKKIWLGVFIFEIIASVAILFALIFMNLAEGIGTMDWLISFALISLHTWIFFWACTFLMSPATVKFIPLGK